MTTRAKKFVLSQHETQKNPENFSIMKLDIETKTIFINMK